MADERTYFVICADGCKFEGMTKEQILAAIEQAANDGKITNVDTGFVTKIKELNRRAALSFWVGSTAEYNALETKEKNCFYILTDDNTGEALDTLIKELTERVEALEAKAEKNGKTLLWSAAGDITGKTIKNITEYTLVKVRPNELYDDVLCMVKVSYDGKTAYINGISSTPSTASDIQHIANTLVFIKCTLDGKNGTITSWNFKYWHIKKGTEITTEIKELNCENMLIVGIM